MTAVKGRVGNGTGCDLPLPPGSMTGVSEPSPLAAAQRSAQALREGGDLMAARRLLTHALESARRTYSEDHPEVLTTAHGLARLHREADDPTTARRVLEEAIAAGQRRLGHADPLMLMMSYDLGSVAEELGNRHEARRNFTRVATVGPAVLGADNWAVRAARDYLRASDGQPVAASPPPVAGPWAAPPRVSPIGSADPMGAPAPAASPVPPLWPRPIQPQSPNKVSRLTQLAPPPSRHDVPAYPEVGVSAMTPYATGRPQSAAVAPPATAQGRGVVIAATAAVIAAVVATVVALVALTDRPPTALGSAQTAAEPIERTPAGSTPAGDPPTDLRLRADGSSITITWTDPTAGTVPFIVAGGRTGTTLGALATVNPGETAFTLNGLNSRVDYCFTVVAVYSSDRYATSGQVCTDRATPTGEQSTTHR